MSDERVSGSSNPPPEAGGQVRTPTNPPERGGVMGGVGQVQQPGPGNNGYITQQEAQRLIEQAVEQATRRAQSLTDKAESRISRTIQERLQSLDEMFDGLRRSGERIPEDVVEHAKRDITTRTILEEAEAERIAASEQDTTAYVNRRAQAIFNEVGVVVDQSDPEAEMVDQSSPEKFLITLAQAAEAKAQRMGAQPQPQAQSGGDRYEQQPGGAARAPAIGAGGVRANPIQNVVQPDELFRMAFNKRR